MTIAKRLRLMIRRIVEAKTTTRTIHYAEMTPEQQRGVEKALDLVDEAFKELDRVSKIEGKP